MSDGNGWDEYFTAWGDLDSYGVCYKFSVGDRVTLKNSSIEYVGTVKKIIDEPVFGKTEYLVSFPENIKYCYEYELVKADISVNSCECGALKTYGKQCSPLHHALWCRMRKDVE